MTKQPVLQEMDQPQLPMWPQDLRGLPNAFARSALFTVAHARKGARDNLKRQTVATLKGISITYTGEELRQDDEDVYLQIIHCARSQDLSQPVKFTASSMIAELGWTRNSASYKRLVECLDRMQASSIAVTVKKSPTASENYTGSLIRSFRWREDAEGPALRQWEILLEREIVALFSPDSYSRLDWKMRLKLSPLEKWLHSFYHTHQAPFAYKVESIHALTGSEVKIEDLRKFRYKLKKALQRLVEIGFFTKAEIEPRTDLVHVERNRTHLSIVGR